MTSLMDDRPGKGTAGPILIQGFLQYLCQGVIITQAVKFYDRWGDDPTALRIYVGVLVLFSILQTMLESYKVWVMTIEGKHWWTSHLHTTEFLCNALICSLCEAFLIRRCYRMTGNKHWILLGFVTLWVTNVVAAIFLTVKIAIVLAPTSIRHNENPLHTSSFAYPLWVYGTLTLAISITSILSFFLWRTRTGLAYLDRTLAYIIALTWESAALPSLCMLASAIIYSIRDAAAATTPSAPSSPPPPPYSPLYLDLFFAILTGKVYTLGLLRTLNARTQFRARMYSGCTIGRRSLSDWQWADASARADPESLTRTSADTNASTGTDTAVGSDRDDGYARPRGDSLVKALATSVVVAVGPFEGGLVDGGYGATSALPPVTRRNAVDFWGGGGGPGMPVNASRLSASRRSVSTNSYLAPTREPVR